MDDFQKALDKAIQDYSNQAGASVVTSYVVVFHATRYRENTEMTSYGYATLGGTQPEHVSQGLIHVASGITDARLMQGLYGGDED